MKMISCDISELINHRRRNSNLHIFEEFLASGLECVKLEDHGHKTARYCQTCLCSSRKRYGFHNIGIALRCGEVYLYRKDR